MKLSSNLKGLLLALFIPVAYLVISLFTLSDYGINWDDPKHLIRGQSYLHFILTGKHDFLDFPAYRPLKGAPDYAGPNLENSLDSTDDQKIKVENPNVRRSYFQSDFYTFDYFMTKHVHTHPEVNGLLSAFTNYIFYQKLGVVGDLESYHLFIVLVSFALVVAVALWTRNHFGILSSMVASFSLAAYPLVFAESHFNVKDPVLMSFFSLSILTFWYGFSKRRFVYILFSALLAGFALGTKFNTLFLPLILTPWVLFVVYQRLKERNLKKSPFLSLIGGGKVLASMLVYPFIALGVLYIFSPYLWIDPVGHFLEIINYYKEIGRGTPEEFSAYLLGGWNTYPLIWVLFTTPLPVLFLSLVGLGYAVFLVFKKHSEIALLVLLWFAVPIIRAIWPGMNIYGGDRQIMEFIPAMAILAGMGAFFIIQNVRQTRLSKAAGLMVFASLVFVVWEMANIHPNQNVYFNQLVGGLKGAQEKKIPSWGNTYGNVYLQGINWLNKNAEPNAKLSLPVNHISAVPRLKLRSDIELNNSHWSGPNRNGEYGMDMYYDWPLRSRYKYAYYETFLNPVYQVEVDGVPLLKIWKNDIQHTRSGFEKEIILKPSSITLIDEQTSHGNKEKKLRLDFDREVFLTRLVIDHTSYNCEEQEGVGFVATSKDGQNWTREPGPFIDPENPKGWMGINENTFVFMFPARIAYSIILNSELSAPCILKEYSVIIWGLDV